MNRHARGRGYAAFVCHEDAVLHEKAHASSAMDGSARHGSGRLDKRHFSSGTVDEAAQLVHPIVEEFDALLRRSILAIDKGEEAVLFESVGVFGGPLNRHPEPFPDRAESGVVARRDFIEEEEAGAHPEISQQLHGLGMEESMQKVAPIFLYTQVHRIILKLT